jgi:hypothetical protein
MLPEHCPYGIDDANTEGFPRIIRDIIINLVCLGDRKIPVIFPNRIDLREEALCHFSPWQFVVPFRIIDERDTGFKEIMSSELMGIIHPIFRDTVFGTGPEVHRQQDRLRRIAFEVKMIQQFRDVVQVGAVVRDIDGGGSCKGVELILKYGGCTGIADDEVAVMPARRDLVERAARQAIGIEQVQCR